VRGIDCNVLTFGQTGQLTELRSRERKGALPLGAYSFGVVRLVDDDRKRLMHDNLERIDAVPNLGFKQAKKLRGLIGERLVTQPPDAGGTALTQLKLDLAANVPQLKASVAAAVAKDLGKSIDPQTFDLSVEQIDEEDFHTQTNLGHVLGVDEISIHKVVERGLLGVAGLNQRLEYMQRYRAVAGFRVDELPLYEDKLRFLMQQVDPEDHMKRFERVVELAGLPDVDPDPRVQDVDLARLLEILGSDEAREFRAWLRGIDDLDDAHVKREVNKLRNLVRGAVHSRAGKTVRFATTAGVGLIPGAQLAALGVGALDAFVLDKVVPEPGPTAFLSRLYPTIFVS
jgi:hypothetical protein